MSTRCTRSQRVRLGCASLRLKTVVCALHTYVSLSVARLLCFTAIVVVICLVLVRMAVVFAPAAMFVLWTSCTTVVVVGRVFAALARALAELALLVKNATLCHRHTSCLTSLVTASSCESIHMHERTPIYTQSMLRTYCWTSCDRGARCQRRSRQTSHARAAATATCTLARLLLPVLAAVSRRQSQTQRSLELAACGHSCCYCCSSRLLLCLLLKCLLGFEKNRK